MFGLSEYDRQTEMLGSIQVKDESGARVTLEIVGGVKGLVNKVGIKAYDRGTGVPNTVVNCFRRLIQDLT